MTAARNRRRAGGLPDATVALAGSYTSNTNLTTYTSGSISIGTPSSSRHIAVVASLGGNATATGSTCTVDGVSLSFVDSRGTDNLEIWFGQVDTANSTGVLEFTWSAGVNSSRFQLFECQNIQSGTATATDTDSGDAVELTASVLAGGIAIAGAHSADVATTFSWTGDLTDHGDIGSGEINTMSTASEAFAAAQTVSTTPNSAGTGAFASVLATFR